MTDLVTFGETMLRLAPPDDTPIELAERFQVHVAGAESNVAVAAQRLGLETTWVSKLPETPPGRRVTGELRRHGVEPAVVWSTDGRQGTYYLETGDEPRGTNVVYDRTGTAVRTATPAELPTDRIEAARAFHTSAITPALSETLAETTAELLARARDADTTTSLDVNYRSKLWSPAQARETLTGLLPDVDVLFVAERDVRRVLARSDPPAAVARDLADEFDLRTVVVTRGDSGAVAVHADETHEQTAFEAADTYPVGSGDAFAGGYLADRLQGASVADALGTGAATAALKRSIPGDVAAVTPEDVERVREGEGSPLSR
jgi:2-dehydro-3-deoxygluconokinase